jgi:hypothetical protein
MRGTPNLLRKSGPPRPASRRESPGFRVPDSRLAARSRGVVFDREDEAKETVMTIISAIGSAACEARVDALQAEFGAVLAARIIEFEELDFLWDGRVLERYLGQYFAQDCGHCDDGEAELSRIAILSFLDGDWHAAVCVVDGDGAALALLWQQGFEKREDAQAAFERAA